MDKIKQLALEFLEESQGDALAIGIIDFKNNTFEGIEFDKNESGFIVDKPEIYFDLASVSKPLINGIGFLAFEKEMTSEMNLVLNHRGGLPAWGLLPKKGWEEIISSYSIKESETLYSDYSALRFMLEFNKKFDKTLEETAKANWDSELIYWKDLTLNERVLQYGYRKGRANIGVVHDPNAFTLDTFVSHAGVFGTIDGVCRTLLGLNKKFDLLHAMNNKLTHSNHRFNGGWDRVEDPENTLAGSGCSSKTFGHLGFTGTSVWIDTEKLKGFVLLSNETKHYWYDKKLLNIYRKKIGQLIWENS